MKKRFITRGLALGLAAVTAFSLCGCAFGKGNGQGGGKKNEGGKHFFNTEYVSNLPEGFGTDRVQGTHLVGDVLYYQYYDENYTTASLYSYNILTGESKELFVGAAEKDESERPLSSINVNDFAPTADGDVFISYTKSELAEEFRNRDYSTASLQDIVDYMVKNWDYTENEAAQEWADYYAGAFTDENGNVDYARALSNFESGYDTIDYFTLIDADGNVKYENVVSEQKYEEQQEGGTYTYISSVTVDANGIPAAIVNEWDSEHDIYFIRVYDKDGKEAGMIELDGWVDSFVNIGGQVYVSMWGEENQELRKVDLKNLTMEEKGIEITGSVFGYYDGNKVLATDYTDIVIFDPASGESEEFINLMDVGISSYSTSAFGMLSDGRVAILYNSGSGMELVLLTEADESEVVQSTTITVACMWLDQYYEQSAIEFNKKHDDVKIKFKQITDDSESWEEMMNNFVTAVANDSSIDIVVFPDVASAQNMISKGLMLDLYPMIDADSDLSREDFIPGILTACEKDGKLMMLGNTFSVRTLVGKSSDVGTEPGWTVDDMKALLASKPEGTQLIYGTTRDQMLMMMMSLGYNDYITADGKCNFDSAEFVQALEFVNMFPEEYEWNEDDDMNMMLHNGEVLLNEFYLSDFNTIQFEETVFGGELTYIGYPSYGDNNGAMISLDSPIGITKNCKNTDLAWEFLRESFLSNDNNYQDSSYYYGNFPVRQDAFDQICKNAMESSDMGTYNFGEFEVKIKPATQESVDRVKDLINGTTALYGAISDDQINIIKEEAACYFSGEQSAESVAKKIQSRMEIYLSETR